MKGQRAGGSITKPKLRPGTVTATPEELWQVLSQAIYQLQFIGKVSGIEKLKQVSRARSQVARSCFAFAGQMKKNKKTIDQA